MHKEALGVAIQTGYEGDLLLEDVNRAFGRFVLNALQNEFPDRNVQIVGERPSKLPKTAQEEVLIERRRLQEIESDASIVAMIANGNPPNSRTAILGGFAVGNRIPIAAMRTTPGRTGEIGMNFNLMLHAAIEKSRGYEDELWEDPLHIAHSHKGFAHELIDAAKYSFAFKKDERKVNHKTDRERYLYPASPFGFAESTYDGFYKQVYLPSLSELAIYKCPWIDGQPLADKAFSVSRNQRTRGLVALGTHHINTVENSSVVVAGVDQEPPDVGTLVEIGVASASGIPVVLYRNDIRTFTLGGKAKFDAAIQAAASYYLSEAEAVAKVNKYVTNVPELIRLVKEVDAPKILLSARN